MRKDLNTQQLSLYGGLPAPPQEPRRVMMLGHGRLGWDEFALMMKQHSVAFVFDVRRTPRAPGAPHFNARPLAERLRAMGIRYWHVPELAGGKKGQPVEELRMFLAALPLDRGTCLLGSESNHEESHRHYLLAPLFIERGVIVEQIVAGVGRLRDGGPTMATLRRKAGVLPQ